MIPATVIDRLFKRMAATYGAAWDRSTGNAPLEDVREVWAHELAGFGSKLQDIAWALEHLPEKCPNVLEFRALCRRAPAPTFQQLEPPKPDAQRIKAVVEHARAAFDSQHKRDPKQWARDVVARRAAGKPVSAISLRFAREALGHASTEQP